MQFLNNLHSFIHRTNICVYNEYLIHNQILVYLPYTTMQCMVKKKPYEKLSSKYWQKLKTLCQTKHIVDTWVRQKNYMFNYISYITIYFII